MKAVIGLIVGLLVGGLGVWFFTEVPEDEEASEMTGAEKAQIEAEVMAFSDDWAAAFNELNADRLAAFWLQENVSSVDFNDRLVGLESISGFYPDLFSGRLSTKMEWLPGRVVDVVSPTAALFQGTVRSEVTPTEGDPFVQQVHFTQFMKKIDGDWKIQRNHVSGGRVQAG